MPVEILCQIVNYLPAPRLDRDELHECNTGHEISVNRTGVMLPNVAESQEHQVSHLNLVSTGNLKRGICLDILWHCKVAEDVNRAHILAATLRVRRNLLRWVFVAKATKNCRKAIVAKGLQLRTGDSHTQSITCLHTVYKLHTEVVDEVVKIHQERKWFGFSE